MPVISLAGNFIILAQVKKKYPLMINKDVDLIGKGNYETVRQNKEEGTYYGKRTPVINWNDDAEDIYNLIRVVSYPYPGVFTNLDNTKILIWKAQVVKDDNNHKPGEVIETKDNTIFQCGSNQLLITDYETEAELKPGDIFNGK